MQLNKEQHKIIEFLYESPDTIFSYDQLKNSGILFTDKDWQLLKKDELINHDGHNKNTYTFQISSKGRAYYEAYLKAVAEERNSQIRRQEDLDYKKKSFRIDLLALVISALALIVSVFALIK